MKLGYSANAYMKYSLPEAIQHIASLGYNGLEILADHVLAFDIILASGNKERIVRPEEGKTTQHNDDVYYAVLGGGKGGDFGIVTHWEFSPLQDKNYPNSACYTFAWLWTKDKMEGAVRSGYLAAGAVLEDALRPITPLVPDLPTSRLYGLFAVE